MSEAFRSLALTIQAVLNRYDPMSGSADAALADADYAPFVILGAPRSGTTLLYQLLCRGAEVSFISNVMAVSPAFMTLLAAPTQRRKPAPDTPYESGDYGFLPGLFAPSEAGKVLDRWFDPDHLKDRRVPTRQMVAALGQRTGRPLLLKSIPLGLHLDRFLSVLPQARFIVISRDPLEVVQSLYLGQSDKTLAADRWKGIQPEGYEALASRGLEYQTAWQVSEIKRRIDAGLQTVEPDRIARVAYDDLCAAPREVLRRLGAELRLKLSTKGVPDRFPASKKRKVSDESWEKILSACEELGLSSGT